jgi:hypothetical protein
VLAGKGVMMNWSNVAPKDRQAYRQWHTEVHIAGRLEVPGFIRGRRYAAVEASRDMLVWYEIENVGVIASEPYLEKANEPVGDLRTNMSVTDSLRNIAAVKHSSGLGIGGYALTLRLDVPPSDEERLVAHLVNDALPAIAKIGEITGAHFCLGDPEVSSIVPAYLQQRLVPGPRWIVIVEGPTVEVLKAAFDAHLSGLERFGCAPPIKPDIYRLEVVVTK